MSSRARLSALHLRLLETLWLAHPNLDEFHGMRNGLACAMDSGGWFIIDVFLTRVNRYIYPELRRDSPPMTIAHLAQLASDGTEDLTKTRWQLSVFIRTGLGKRGATWWAIIVKVFGIRAVVGHTAVGFLEDDRLLKPFHTLRMTYFRASLTTPRSRTSARSSPTASRLEATALPALSTHSYPLST